MARSSRKMVRRIMDSVLSAHLRSDLDTLATSGKIFALGPSFSSSLPSSSQFFPRDSERLIGRRLVVKTGEARCMR
jgi:hypothetical protein